MDKDVAYLSGHGFPNEVIRFDGGHEFTDEFRAAAGRWIEMIG
jgi:hypothetical protein